MVHNKHKYIICHIGLHFKYQMKLIKLPASDALYHFKGSPSLNVCLDAVLNLIEMIL